MRTAGNPRMNILAGLVVTAACLPVSAVPPPVEGDFVLRDFRFVSGETMPELRIHYRTFGRLERDARGTARNAVLVLHGTTGERRASSCGSEFAGELFGPGQLLDATPLSSSSCPTDIGHGQSSKPSDGLHARVSPLRLPRHGRGAVPAAHRGARGQSPAPGDGHLDGRHAHLAVGRAASRFHGRADAARQPADADLRPQPRVAPRRHRCDPRTIPSGRDGDYSTQPPSLRTAARDAVASWQQPGVLRQRETPTLGRGDRVLDAFVASEAQDRRRQRRALRARGVPRLRSGSRARNGSSARAGAVNSADDLINPPELRILEREIGRVRHGRAVVLPFSEKTRGHGTHTLAALWKQYLVELLQASAEHNAVE